MILRQHVRTELCIWQ